MRCPANNLAKRDSHSAHQQLGETSLRMGAHPIAYRSKIKTHPFTTYCQVQQFLEAHFEVSEVKSPAGHFIRVPAGNLRKK